MKKLSAVLLFIFCSFFSVKAQQMEGANWMFGGWGRTGLPGIHLNFTGQKPVYNPFHYDYNAGAGVATISDRNGQLLFFTSIGHIATRQKINNQYQQMPNGNIFGTSINSWPPDVSSEIIIKSPGNVNIYYIFFVTDYYRELYVAQVDMRLNNGNGDVVPNSKRLLKKGVGPSMAAMLHSNNKFSWIINQNRVGDSIFAFLLDSTGINLTVGSKINKLLDGKTFLKGSPNSELFVASSNQSVEIFQFDRSSGGTSHLYSLTVPSPNLQKAWVYSFSPNNAKLYVGTHKIANVPNAKYSIIQYDLSSRNTTQIQQSANIIHNQSFEEQSNRIEDMQLAIDGKIYITRVDTIQALSQISCPDNYGLNCNFKLRGVRMIKTGQGGLTLPALNQTIFRNAGILQAQAFRDTICYGDSVQLSAYGAGAEHFQWQAANGLSFPSDTLSNPFVKPTQTTTYTVTGSSVCSQSTASVTVVVLPKPAVTISGSASVCPQVQGVWYKASNPQKQQITWGIKGGSIATTSNDSISVNWGNASNTAQVWAVSKNRLGCPGDTVFFPVTINVILATENPKGPDTLCLNEAKNISYRINKTTGSVYTWGIKGGTAVSGQGTNSIKVNWEQVGMCKLWVQEESHTSTSHCFGVSDTLMVIVQPIPDSIQKISGPTQVFTFAENLVYEIENPLPGLTYNWQVSGSNITSGQGSNKISVNWENAGTGLVEAIAKNEFGCESNKATLTVQISGAPQPVFYNIITPNQDNKNDAFVIENLKWYDENELVIYNRWGVEVFRNRNYKNDWQAENLSSGVYFYRFQSGKQSWKGWLEVAK